MDEKEQRQCLREGKKIGQLFNITFDANITLDIAARRPGALLVEGHNMQLQMDTRKAV